MKRTLTLVAPVYNGAEMARELVRSLGELEAAAEASGFELVETILVDDGSEEELDIGEEDKAGREVRVLRNGENRGKGYSVRRGALAAKGEWVLMSDVDASAPLGEFRKLAGEAEAWMACGSRHGRRGMPLRRKALSRVYCLLVRITGVRGVRDTQCGFKLFRMGVMRGVFEAMRTERFAFDVELIGRVKRAGGTVKEVQVDWRGGKPSSLRILRDAPRMLIDLFKIRRMLAEAGK